MLGEPTDKICSKCRQLLPIQEFHKNGSCKRRRSYCRACSTRQTREWRLRQTKRFYREKRRRAVARNPRSYFVSQAKRLAKNAGVPFDLSKEDIELPTHCPLLEIPIVYFARGRRVDGSASLDRLVPAHGYVRGNVKIISELANRIKTNATSEQIKTIASNIDVYFEGSSVRGASSKETR